MTNKSYFVLGPIDILIFKSMSAIALVHHDNYL